MESDPSDFVRNIFQQWSQQGGQDNTLASNQNQDAGLTFSIWEDLFANTPATMFELFPLLSSAHDLVSASLVLSSTMSVENPQDTQQQDTTTSLGDSAGIGVLRVTSLPHLRPHKGLWATVEYGLLSTGLVEEVVLAFKAFCGSADFVSKWVEAGFSDPVFITNPHLTEGNPCVDKFQAGLASLGSIATLGCAFHGTNSHNVPSILKDGLDPARRRGQSLGPGEYFGKTPKDSFSYCRNGHEMIVVVIVIPTDQNHFSTVVVKNNRHQIPLGTVCFERAPRNRFRSRNIHANASFLAAAAPNAAPAPNLTVFPSQILRLQNEVEEKTKAKKEAALLAKIVRLIIRNMIVPASELYIKNKAQLQDISKNEIAWYVKAHLDQDVIVYYFPDLPEPIDSIRSLNYLVARE